MNIPLIVNVIIFIALLFLLGRTRKTDWSLAKKVLAGLCLGIVFGLALHGFYGTNSLVLQESVQWFNLVGKGYVKLLQMVVMPLVFVSILGAVIKQSR